MASEVCFLVHWEVPLKISNIHRQENEYAAKIPGMQPAHFSYSLSAGGHSLAKHNPNVATLIISENHY